MTASSPQLERVGRRFEQVRIAQETFVQSLPSLERTNGTRRSTIGTRQQETLCEMTFVVLLSAWEQFLENAFELLVVEARATSFRKQNRVLVVDSETAHDLIRGRRRYFDWTDSAIVRETAKVFFKGGEPFESALSSIASDFQRMKIIRNRCVHFSQHARAQYKKMIRDIFGSGRLVTPGSLLMNAPPKGLSVAANVRNYASVFKLYSEILATASCQIVPVRKQKP